jgi:hypothetical protein
MKIIAPKTLGQAQVNEGLGRRRSRLSTASNEEVILSQVTVTVKKNDKSCFSLRGYAGQVQPEPAPAGKPFTVSNLR